MPSWYMIASFLEWCHDHLLIIISIANEIREVSL